MKNTFLSLSVAVMLVSASVANADVVKPTAVTSTVAGNAGSSADYLLNDNAGQALDSLQRPVGSAATLLSGASLADALATFAQLGGPGHQESWTRQTGQGNPVFSFDLGSELSVGSILLWNYGNDGGANAADPGKNGNSTREFELIFHTDAEGVAFDFASDGGAEATEFSGTMLRPADAVNGPSTDDNGAQFFGFGASETARYVGLRIASNYLGEPDVTAGGDRYGLGEVRFATELQIPEPSSIALISLGLVSLSGLTRRRK